MIRLLLLPLIEETDEPGEPLIGFVRLQANLLRERLLRVLKGSRRHHPRCSVVAREGLGIDEAVVTCHIANVIEVGGVGKERRLPQIPLQPKTGQRHLIGQRLGDELTAHQVPAFRGGELRPPLIHILAMYALEVNRRCDGESREGLVG